nr:MAG TPA: hypothetical protein [Caudoviricetes sp.]
MFTCKPSKIFKKIKLNTIYYQKSSAYAGGFFDV